MSRDASTYRAARRNKQRTTVSTGNYVPHKVKGKKYPYNSKKRGWK
jgi:hypothetical protein